MLSQIQTSTKAGMGFDGNYNNFTVRYSRNDIMKITEVRVYTPKTSHSGEVSESSCENSVKLLYIKISFQKCY